MRTETKPTAELNGHNCWFEEDEGEEEEEAEVGVGAQRELGQTISGVVASARRANHEPHSLTSQGRQLRGQCIRGVRGDFPCLS